MITHFTPPTYPKNAQVQSTPAIAPVTLCVIEDSSFQSDGFWASLGNGKDTATPFQRLSSKAKKSRKRKAASFIDVKLSQVTSSKCAKLRNEKKKELKQIDKQNSGISSITDNSDVEYDMDDFYSETHEEQGKLFSVEPNNYFMNS